MNSIEIDGRVLEYQVCSKASEFDTWYWTEFYEGEVVTQKRVGLPFIGRIVEQRKPRRLFRLHIDIDSPFHGKEVVREFIRERLRAIGFNENE